MIVDEEIEPEGWTHFSYIIKGFNWENLHSRNALIR